MYDINAIATHCKDFNYVKLAKEILVLCNFVEEEPSCWRLPLLKRCFSIAQTVGQRAVGNKQFQEKPYSIIVKIKCILD